MLVSRFINSEKNKCFLEVDGRPFLFQSVHVMHADDNATAELWAKKAKDVGFELMSPWVYWRTIEQNPGEFCFDDIKLLVDTAVKYDIRLDLIWGGTNFCGRIDARFVPEWIIENKDFLYCDENGEFVTVNGGDVGDCLVANVSNKELLKLEQNALKMLISFLEKYDVSHRVISIQLGNEINMSGYTAGKSQTLGYFDSLAATVAVQNYHIATRITVSDWLRTGADEEIKKYKNIRAIGFSIFSPKVSYTREMIKNYDEKTFKHIGCNSAFENSSAHIIAALTNGGFYHIYRLDHDPIWDRNSVYGEDWKETISTLQIRNINTAINKAGTLIAEAAPSDMAEFNTESDGFPDMFYSASKPLGGAQIGFLSKYNFACAFAIYSDGYYYIFSDGNIDFYINKPLESCENGYFDKCGNFCVQNSVFVSEYDGYSYVGYKTGDCLRIKPSIL